MHEPNVLCRIPVEGSLQGVSVLRDSMDVLEHVVSHRFIFAVISVGCVCGEPLGKALRHYGISETFCAVR